MPNTKLAERRMRNSARKNLHNRGIKSRLHTIEVSYLELLSAGKKEEAAKQLRTISSAFDKAAKSGRSAPRYRRPQEVTAGRAFGPG